MEQAEMRFVRGNDVTLLVTVKIPVLDSEGIRERGTHKELIKQDGIYEKYYRMQLSAI